MFDTCPPIVDRMATAATDTRARMSAYSTIAWPLSRSRRARAARSIRTGKSLMVSMGPAFLSFGRMVGRFLRRPMSILEKLRNSIHSRHGVRSRIDAFGDRLRALGQPWELMAFLWVPAIVLGFACWFELRARDTLQDFGIFR